MIIDFIVRNRALMGVPQECLITYSENGALSYQAKFTRLNLFDSSFRVINMIFD